MADRDPHGALRRRPVGRRPDAGAPRDGRRGPPRGGGGGHRPVAGPDAGRVAVRHHHLRGALPRPRPGRCRASLVPAAGADHARGRSLQGRQRRDPRRPSPGSTGPFVVGVVAAAVSGWVAIWGCSATCAGTATHSSSSTGCSWLRVLLLIVTGRGRSDVLIAWRAIRPQSSRGAASPSLGSSSSSQTWSRRRRRSTAVPTRCRRWVLWRSGSVADSARRVRGPAKCACMSHAVLRPTSCAAPLDRAVGAGLRPCSGTPGRARCRSPPGCCCRSGRRRRCCWPCRWC